MPPRFVPLALVAGVDVVPNRLVHVRPVSIPGEDFQCFCVAPVFYNLGIVILFEDMQSEVRFFGDVQTTFVPQEPVVQ